MVSPNIMVYLLKDFHHFEFLWKSHYTLHSLKPTVWLLKQFSRSLFGWWSMHSSLLRTFGLSAISTYNWYLPSIFGTNALIWGYFWNVRKGRFWGHWGLRSLRLQPRNFSIISESLAANLEKVRQTSVWQTVPKFWFIWLFYCSSKTYSCK